MKFSPSFETVTSRPRASAWVMCALPTCAEAIRLRQVYDPALRRWGETLFLPKLGLIGAPRERAVRTKVAAFEARNEAASHLATHKANCFVCHCEFLKVNRRREKPLP